MAAKVEHIQSVASEDAAVHLKSFEGFPPHHGKRADEYKVVDKPLTCNRCIQIAVEDPNQPTITREDLEDFNSSPSSITFKVTFDKIDPVTKEIVQRIVVENVDANDPMDAIEIAVEDHLRVTVVQENTFVFNPGE